jgi:predicted HicB family RNase H-like nuclease
MKRTTNLTYKGFHGSINFDQEEKIFFGQIEFIKEYGSAHPNAQINKDACKAVEDEGLEFASEETLTDNNNNNNYNKKTKTN